MKKTVLLAILAVTFLLFTSCDKVEEIAPEYLLEVENRREEIDAVYPSLGDVPTLYIDVSGGGINYVDKETYVEATVTLSGSDIIESYASVKGRGNASWTLPQKPYNIKFENDTDLLGMGEAKTWVLITLYYDKTLLRNYLTLNLAVDIDVASAVECRFVNVFFNGEYNGLYLLTEKIQDNENRVDISKKNGDALFEIELPYRHNNKCGDCINLKSGTHLMFSDPEPDELTRGEFTTLKTNMTKLLEKVDSAIRGYRYDEYSQLIDIDSFINWYIVNEFVKNYDSQFVTSCYCYVKDGILYMGPAWDYDTCLGNQDVATCLRPEGYHISANSPWYYYLFRSEQFKKRLIERWQELTNAGVWENLLTQIKEATEYLEKASDLQFERWRTSLASTDLRGGRAKFTYEEELAYLEDWIIKRTAWLSGEWK